jgi:hypothetical protein
MVTHHPALPIYRIFYDADITFHGAKHARPRDHRQQPTQAPLPKAIASQALDHPEALFEVYEWRMLLSQDVAMSSNGSLVGEW